MRTQYELLILPWCSAIFQKNQFFSEERHSFSEVQEQQHHHYNIIFVTSSVWRDNWKSSKQASANLIRILEIWKFRRADPTPVLGLLLLTSCANAMLWSSIPTIVKMFRRSLQTRTYQTKLALALNCVNILLIGEGLYF